MSAKLLVYHHCKISFLIKDNSYICLQTSYIKELIKNDPDTTTLISFDCVYNLYCKYCKHMSYKFVVSKRFFEKYLYFKLFDYIVYDKFIKIEWINA